MSNNGNTSNYNDDKSSNDFGMMSSSEDEDEEEEEENESFDCNNSFSNENALFGNSVNGLMEQQQQQPQMLPSASSLLTMNLQNDEIQLDGSNHLNNSTKFTHVNHLINSIQLNNQQFISSNTSFTSNSSSQHHSQAKKPRLVFTDIQRRTLQAIFKETKRPSKEMQVTIAQQLGLEVATVSNFFMNARRRSMDKWKEQDEDTNSNSSSCKE